MAILWSLGYRALTSAYPAARIWNRDWERTGQFRASLETTVHIPLLPRKARINSRLIWEKGSSGIISVPGVHPGPKHSTASLPTSFRFFFHSMMHAFSSYFLFPQERDELPKELAIFVRYPGPRKYAVFWVDCHRPPNPVPLSYFYWYPLVLIIT